MVNADATGHLAIVEHLAWSDQATTAAEVTSLQLFRDLFSREVLRPGEQISVGSMTVVFTDLKNSTQLYQEIGDAPAFGRVLTHFEILKAAVAYAKAARRAPGKAAEPKPPAVHHAVAPGGHVLIRDIVMDPSRTAPVAGALFAINMLVGTRHGGTFTFDELREDLEQAGFIDVMLLRSDEGMHSVVQAVRG